ncbi:hypothetical protein [Actinomadura parmotrematis]|uniref:Uncharacterized protein n=1 Tax=Actinomadura parmotrematis TaxID=2864039 RepID=A0ABS7G1G4_9ACTN|nr:hypothetical protein [Actinomadura parmotrematis]MBW8486341.1 hypothetical protein [Actinomadura parmotrematis]
MPNLHGSGSSRGEQANGARFPWRSDLRETGDRLYALAGLAGELHHLGWTSILYVPGRGQAVLAVPKPRPAIGNLDVAVASASDGRVFVWGGVVQCPAADPARAAWMVARTVA